MITMGDYNKINKKNKRKHLDLDTFDSEKFLNLNKDLDIEKDDNTKNPFITVFDKPEFDCNNTSLNRGDKFYINENKKSSTRKFNYINLYKSMSGSKINYNSTSPRKSTEIVYSLKGKNNGIILSPKKNKNKIIESANKKKVVNKIEM